MLRELLYLINHLMLYLIKDPLDIKYIYHIYQISIFHSIRLELYSLRLTTHHVNRFDTMNLVCSANDKWHVFLFSQAFEYQDDELDELDEESVVISDSEDDTETSAKEGDEEEEEEEENEENEEEGSSEDENGDYKPAKKHAKLAKGRSTRSSRRLVFCWHFGTKLGFGCNISINSKLNSLICFK